MKKVLLGIAVLLTASTGFTGTYLTDTVEYSAGSGTNSATIVVDFDLDNYFVFTYSWDGTATGWDALSALTATGDLDEVHFGQPGVSYGVFVSDLDYPTGVEHDYGASVNTGWTYYGSANNEAWSLNDGVSKRQLTDGAFDSWVWSNYSSDWMTAYRTPGAAPIPEPGTLALLGLGGLLLRRKASS